MTDDADVVPHIGTLNEGSLHAALKDHYAMPGDRFEVPLDGFVIDILRPGRLIEIQTGSFASMANKLDALLDRYEMTIVHPIARHTWLRRDSRPPRRSPKHGSVYNVFDELVSVPTMIDHPSLTLDIVIVDVDKVQRADPSMRRRRGGFRTVDRVLREIVDVYRFGSTGDLKRLLPDRLPEKFTTADIAQLGGVDRATAQKMAYCFRALGLFEEVARTRVGVAYRMT